jgi:hypothetical protein
MVKQQLICNILFPNRVSITNLFVIIMDSNDKFAYSPCFKESLQLKSMIDLMADLIIIRII